MIIEGIRKTTLLDYPGNVACTVFTHGCNLRCPFCHNASLVVRPHGDGIEREELFSFLEKRKGILDGVCITGGEPLLQPDIKDFIKDIRANGYKIKLDTNGFFPERLEELIGEHLIDYVAVDIKSSKENYPLAVGIKAPDISKIDKSVELLLNGDTPYEFRTTAVKGLHTKDDFYRIGEWIKGCKRYFVQQFTDSGDLIGFGFAPFGKEESLALLEEVRKNVPCAELRGI